MPWLAIQKNKNDAPPLPPGGDTAPGFEAMKAVAVPPKDLIAAVDRKPPSVVTRQDAPVASSNGDTNHENNLDRNPSWNHAKSGDGASRLPPGRDTSPPRRLRQANVSGSIDLQNGHLSEGALSRATRVIGAAVRQDTRDRSMEQQRQCRPRLPRRPAR